MVFDEGALQRVELVAVGESFDGADLLACGLHGEHQAGTHRIAVDNYRAGSAHPVLAARIRSGQPAFVAQRVGEGAARLDAQRVVPAVDIESDIDLVDHEFRSAASKARCTAVRVSWRL